MINQINYTFNEKQFELHRVVQFEDIFPDEESIDVISILKKYNRKSAVLNACIISFYYSEAYFQDNKRPFFFYTQNHKDIISRIETYINKQHSEKTYYTTTRSTMELIRIIFSIPCEEYKDTGNIKDIRYDFFKIILTLNKKCLDFISDNKNKNLNSLFFILNYVHNDMSEQNIGKTFFTQKIYFNKLIYFLDKNEYIKEAKNKLLQKIGIESFDEYHSAIERCILFAMIHKEKSNLILPHIRFNKSVPILDFLSIDINKCISIDSGLNGSPSRTDNIDYRIFRSQPLIKIDDNDYLIYNLSIIIERLYNSLFFDLKAFFKGDFFDFYNKNFIEDTLFKEQIVKCLNSKSTSIGQTVDKHATKGLSDFYIREEDCIIIFECKGIKLNGLLKDNPNINEIMNVLENKLYCSNHNIDKTRMPKIKNENVGISQLVKSIHMIENGSCPFDNYKPNNKTIYYPVIIIEDPKIVVSGLSGIINDLYISLFEKDKSMHQNYKPIIVMSIDILYCYENVFKENGFHKIFDDFFNSEIINSGINSIDISSRALSNFNDYIENKYINESLITKEPEHIFS